MKVYRALSISTNNAHTISLHLYVSNGKSIDCHVINL